MRAAHPEIDALRFPVLTLLEPPKEDVQGHRSGDAIDRKAFAVVYDRATGSVHECVVDLRGPSIESWVAVPGVQPSILWEEVLGLEDIVAKSDEARAALALRDVHDLEKVQYDPWAGGTLPVDGVDLGRRLIRVTPSLRESPGDNGYAHPIENLVFLVDPAGRRGGQGDRRRRHPDPPRARELRRGVGRDPPDGPASSRHHPARRPELHDRGPPHPVARLEPARVGAYR